MKTNYQSSCEQCPLRSLHEQSALIMENVRKSQIGNADIMQTDDILVNSLLKPDYQAPSWLELVKAGAEEHEIDKPIVSYTLQEAEISCSGLTSHSCPAEVKQAALIEI